FVCGGGGHSASNETQVRVPPSTLKEVPKNGTSFLFVVEKTQTNKGAPKGYAFSLFLNDN
ncbi:MAG: hypothetical protein KBS94_05245, partial [Prevotella sp.]|nr:hypothetical protein [Candidatus Equicola faecalis]